MWGTEKWILALMVLASAAAAAFVASPSASAAPPPLLDQFPQNGDAGPGAGQLAVPAGVATDPATGHVYVAEVVNNRVSEFTASGQFVEAFGWDVAPEGAPGDTPEDQLEVCTDVCQSGTAGAGAGQLNSPVGLAVGASGAIYLAETENLRVQKFSASGEFLLMFGAEVNKTNGGDLCTRADLEGGDVCGAGVEGTGPGEFSGWAGGDFIDAAADGTVLVGDQSRVQSFDENGVYVGEIPLPEERSVRALAFDPGSDDLYVAVNQAFALEFPEVPVFYRLDAGSGALIDEIEVGNPDGTADNQFPLYGFTLGLATDSAGNVYAVVQQNQTLKQIWLEVAGFDPSGACLPGLCPGDEFAKGENGTRPAMRAESPATICSSPIRVQAKATSAPTAQLRSAM